MSVKKIQCLSYSSLIVSVCVCGGGGGGGGGNSHHHTPIFSSVRGGGGGGCYFRHVGHIVLFVPKL